MTLLLTKDCTIVEGNFQVGDVVSRNAVIELDQHLPKGMAVIFQNTTEITKAGIFSGEGTGVVGNPGNLPPDQVNF
jgi:hypothetical protein